MSDVKVGRLIDAKEQRDAIHIAIAPVIATHRMVPGDHVGFVSDDHERVGMSGVHIGIVDPFLNDHVKTGQRFWLCLYPQSITSLRHDWTHPAFTDMSAPVDESRAWIQVFAKELDQTERQLMAAARLKIEDNDYTYDNTETYKDVDYNKWPIFWKHYAIVTGRPVSETGCPYTCSC